jgi:hypothetical protein
LVIKKQDDIFYLSKPIKVQKIGENIASPLWIYQFSRYRIFVRIRYNQARVMRKKNAGLREPAAPSFE